jgi:hypothetical protein
LGGYGYTGAGGSGSQHLGVESRAYRPATPNSRYVYGYAIIESPELFLLEFKVRGRRKKQYQGRKGRLKG